MIKTSGDNSIFVNSGAYALNPILANPILLPKITYFFRKPAAAFYSIELLFDTVIKHLRRCEAEKVVLPESTGENKWAILKNLIFARNHQSAINHITGEVYYIAFVLNRRRTVLTIHDIDSLGSTHKFKNQLLQLFWLRLPVRRVKYVTVVSEYSKRKLLAATGVAEEKVVVIPNCVELSDADFRPKAEINKQEPVLLQVGTKPNKNLENLVKAIEGTPCKLLILGRLTPEQTRLLRCSNMNYEQYQDLPYPEVKALYYRADIVTFVSTFEGFGMPILESNALGRPVITSTTTSMPEVAGKAALLVEPFDQAAIRKGIERLISDDQLRQHLVAEGYENVQRFRPERVAALYEELYEKVLR